MISQKQLDLESENYILNDKVIALEQLLKLKDDQLQNMKHDNQDEDSDKKIKKLTLKIQTLKQERKKDQELIATVKEKLRKREDDIREWQ